MIIDANANLGNWPFRRMQYNSPGSLLQRLARVGITHAWVASLDAVMYKDCHAANAPLAEATAAHEVLLPLATINPSFPGWERDLAECAEELGFRAVRTYPNYQQYSLGDPAFDELLAAAEELSFFVSVAVRMTDERHHHPLCQVPPTDLKPLPEAAAAHPNLSILVVNANNSDLTPLIEPTRDLQNLFFDLSRIESAGGVEKLGRQLGLDRLLFGTHAPYYLPESAMLKVTRECEFTSEELDAILHGNAERLLHQLQERLQPRGDS
jgi:predicted TIM-barrel fold metal-dependent hydrolase